MEKRLEIDINDYITLEILYLLDNYSLYKTLERKIKRIICYLEKKIYTNFFENLGNLEIKKEHFEIKYIFE